MTAQVPKRKSRDETGSMGELGQAVCEANSTNSIACASGPSRTGVCLNMPHLVETYVAIPPENIGPQCQEYAEERRKVEMGEGLISHNKICLTGP